MNQTIQQHSLPEKIEDFPPDVVEALRGHDLIGAIKRLRAARGIDLATAKELVEKLQAKIQNEPGRPAKRKSLAGPLLAVLALLVGTPIALSLFSGAGPAPVSNKITFTPQMQAAVGSILDPGLGRVDVQMHKLWIAPSFWLIADAQKKEELAATFSIYFADKNNVEVYHCEVFDMQSGRRLARYSQSSGFRVD